MRTRFDSYKHVPTDEQWEQVLNVNWRELKQQTFSALLNGEEVHGLLLEACQKDGTIMMNGTNANRINVFLEHRVPNFRLVRMSGEHGYYKLRVHKRRQKI